ncbi:RidA family protein [Paenibacillus sp. GCM10023250]|uniref:RidA family protein n=1 Tax=Paenibacillus sp. GCM10023250 TaxID=3252648 RepID=UPI003614BA9A
MKRAIATPENGSLPFSSAIQAGPFVFVSGQGGLDPVTGRVVGSDLEAQTVRTMENIRLILTDRKLGMDDIVKVNVYLKDRSLYAEFNDVYKRYFTPPFPARTTIYCDLNFDLLVEIDATAFVSESTTG